MITKTAKPVDTNVFASPWKKSDVVLLVEGQEFHVHRAILMMQSPVFEAMLDGHFREASQKVITLKEKTSEGMLQFLKLLYPVNMIKKPLIPFDDKNILKILQLADEYQAEDCMRHLLTKIVITKNNVFKILPYATKYDGEVRKKCIRVVSSEMAITALEKKLPALEAEQPELVKELLVAKCHHLEQLLRNHGIDLHRPTSINKPHCDLLGAALASSSPLRFSG